MGNALQDVRIVSFESRHADDLGRLIERRGGTAVPAPSMREAPLEAQEHVLAFGNRLLGGEVDALVLLTGAGTRMLVQVLSTRWSRDEIVAALSRSWRICRGPKPVAALKELGLTASAVAPDPNTWRELVAAMDETLSLAGLRVAVQEYGRRNEALLDALRDRGARVEPVTLYRWQLPEDTGPLRAALGRIARGEVDAVLFTSANQVDNVLTVAREEGHTEAMRRAFGDRVLVASVGPTTSDALREHGIEPDVEPERPKMGSLVAAVADRASKIS